MNMKKGIYLSIILLISFAVIIAYNPMPYTGRYIESGGAFYCYNCSDCMAALNNNTYNTVYLAANITLSVPEKRCIDNPANFSNKIFDCQNNFIEGEGKNNFPFEDYNSIFINNKENITIRNCEFGKFPFNIYINSSSNIEIYDNIIRDDYIGVGIGLEGDSDTAGVISIHDNYFYRNDNWPILIYNANNSFVYNNLIVESSVGDPVHNSGMYIINSSYTHIFNNTVKDSYGRGIHVLNSNNINMSENRVDGSRRTAGIHFEISDSNTIYKNTLINHNSGTAFVAALYLTNSFDNITAVFIVNYLTNLKITLKELKRILKKNGKLIIVNSKKPVIRLYKTQEKKFWQPNELKKLLISLNFKVTAEEKRINNTKLIFIEAVK